MVNIKSIKNYLKPILRKEYYTIIKPNAPLSNPYLDVELNLDTITKNKKTYLNYSITIITDSMESPYLSLLNSANNLLNNYLSQPKYFKDISKTFSITSSLYHNTYTITLTREEAINLYTLFKLTNKHTSLFY